MKCKNCGHENNNDNRFCIKCGKELDRDELVVCDVCGADNPSGSLYCIKCGREIGKKEFYADARIVNKKLCPKCGYKNNEYNLYCTSCGTSLDGAAVMQIYEYEKERTESRPVVSPSKKPYKYQKFTITTLVLTFALTLLPILGQFITITMSLISLFLSVKEYKESKSEPTKTAIVMSVIALICSIAIMAINIISLISYMNIHPYSDIFDDPDDQTVTMMIKNILIRR